MVDFTVNLSHKKGLKVWPRIMRAQGCIRGHYSKNLGAANSWGSFLLDQWSHGNPSVGIRCHDSRSTNTRRDDDRTLIGGAAPPTAAVTTTATADGDEKNNRSSDHCYFGRNTQVNKPSKES